MSPVGRGANLAMLNGAALGAMLTADRDDIPGAGSAYERETFQRFAAAARTSADVRAMLAAPDAGQRMLAYFGPADPHPESAARQSFQTDPHVAMGHVMAASWAMSWHHDYLKMTLH